MKNLIIVLSFIIFNIITVQAQQTNLRKMTASELGRPGTGKDIYIYDNNLDKFEGRWTGTKGEISAKMILIKKSFRLSNNNNTEIELIKGTLQITKMGKLIAFYSLKASIGSGKDTLNIFIDIHLRKSQEALAAVYLKSDTLKLDIGQPIYESRNDKDFEVKEPIILIKQN